MIMQFLTRHRSIWSRILWTTLICRFRNNFSTPTPTPGSLFKIRCFLLKSIWSFTRQVQQLKDKSKKLSIGNMQANHEMEQSASNAEAQQTHNLKKKLGRRPSFERQVQETKHWQHASQPWDGTVSKQHRHPTDPQLKKEAWPKAKLRKTSPRNQTLGTCKPIMRWNSQQATQTPNRPTT